MKESKNNNPNFFKGAGFLFGFVIAIVAAILVFIISENVAIAITTTLPIGITVGIGLEQRFQGEEKIISPKTTKIMLGLLSVGVLLFIALFVLVNLI